MTYRSTPLRFGWQRVYILRGKRTPYFASMARMNDADPHGVPERTDQPRNWFSVSGDGTLNQRTYFV